MRAWMGIDGGGSNLRVVIVDDDLHILAQIERADSANPNAAGHDAAATLIQQAVRAAVAQYPESISGVGIGIAGAAAVHSEAWLRSVVEDVLPDTLIVPSSDYEIALVGATAERRGVLVISGTGSVAFGVNDSGQALQVGGWGYLVGDEGSGYWMGMEALRTMIREADGTHVYFSSLGQRVCDALGFAKAQDVIPWLYSSPPRTRKIAALAQIVLQEAATDERAAQIVEAAAQSLHLLVRTLIERLALQNPPLAFGGGLLTSDTLLRRHLCILLKLSAPPVSKYSSVIGAALLAKLHKEGHL